jgi:hypothetical protein
LEILENTKTKYDVSLALTLADFKIFERVVYQSKSAGVSDWSFPPVNEMSWHNPLTGIECHF